MIVVTGRNYKMPVIGPMWEQLFRELPVRRVS
jgi:hypothetical protein